MICTVKTSTHFGWLGCFCSALILVTSQLAYATPDEVQVDHRIEEKTDAKQETPPTHSSASQDPNVEKDVSADGEEEEDEIFDGEDETGNSQSTPVPQESIGRSGDSESEQLLNTKSHDASGNLGPQNPTAVSADTVQGSTNKTTPINEDSPSDSGADTRVERTLDVVTIIGNQLKLDRATGSAHKVSSKLLEAQARAKEIIEEAEEEAKTIRGE